MRTFAHSVLCAALAALFISVPNALGEALRLTAEQRIHLATELGFDPNGPRMERLLQSHRAKGRGVPLDLSRDPRFVAMRNSDSNKVLKHVRGKKGVLIPAAEEIPTLSEIVADKEQLDKIDLRPFLKKSIIEPMEQDLKFQPLPMCRSDKTEKTKTGAAISRGKDAVVMDLLFVRPGAKPLDPDEVFGEHVNMIEYVHEKPTAQGFMARGYEVRCLPTRFRATKTMLYRHEGMDALKNFDKQIHGKGEFHEEVKAKPRKFM